MQSEFLTLNETYNYLDKPGAVDIKEIKQSKILINDKLDIYLSDIIFVNGVPHGLAPLIIGSQYNSEVIGTVNFEKGVIISINIKKYNCEHIYRGKFNLNCTLIEGTRVSKIGAIAGVTISTTNYLDGKYHGFYTDVKDDSDDYKIIGTFYHGQMDGPWWKIDRGLLVSSAYFINGIAEGKYLHIPTYLSLTDMKKYKASIQYALNGSFLHVEQAKQHYIGYYYTGMFNLHKYLPDVLAELILKYNVPQQEEILSWYP